MAVGISLAVSVFSLHPVACVERLFWQELDADEKTMPFRKKFLTNKRAAS